MGGKGLQEIEVDGLAVLEERLVMEMHPYEAYLIRRVLNILASGWTMKHPYYKHEGAEG